MGSRAKSNGSANYHFFQAFLFGLAVETMNRFSQQGLRKIYFTVSRAVNRRAEREKVCPHHRVAISRQ
jgi:hypothetical protein